MANQHIRLGLIAILITVAIPIFLIMAFPARTVQSASPSLNREILLPTRTPDDSGESNLEIPLGRITEISPLSMQSSLPPSTNFLSDASPPPSMSFEGIGMEADNNSPRKVHTPPDTHAAVGPNRIVAVTNGHVAIYDKSGAILAGGTSGLVPVDLDDFCGDSSDEARCFDPKVVYDQYAGRFVAIALEGRTASESRMHLMVSKTNSPANLSSDWNRITLEGTTQISGSEGWLDYPGLGVSPEAVVITGNLFADNFIFLGTKIRVIDKSTLYDGDQNASYVDINNNDLRDFSIQPALHFGSPPAGTFYLLQRYFSGRLKVWALSGTPTNPVVHTQIVATADQGNCISEAPQKDTDKKVDTVCTRMMDAVWRDGSLWGALTGTDSSGTRTAVHWFEIRTNGYPSNSPTLMQHGAIDGGPGEFTYMPSIGVDACNNVGLVYTQSSNARYPEVRYAARLASDAPNSLRGPVMAKESAGFQDDFSGPARERWGDYSATVIDPANQSFWVAQEYVRTPIKLGNDSRWGTWHANFSLGCQVNPVAKIYLPWISR
jgi:hypothetical protein